jgi:hypothetical protein
MPRAPQTIRLQDLITSAYEVALEESGDPEEARRLAAAVVTQILMRTGNLRALAHLTEEPEEGADLIEPV